VATAVDLAAAVRALLKSDKALLEAAGCCRSAAEDP